MTKSYYKDFFMVLLSVVIIILITSQSLLVEKINIGNTYLTIADLVSVVLFVIILILKNNERIFLMFDVLRMDMPRLISLCTHNFIAFSFIITFIYLSEINLFIGIILIFLEFFLLIVNILIMVKNISFTRNRDILKIKEYIFSVLILDLILNNIPFEIFAIPVDSVLIATYSVIMLYISFLAVEILRPEL